MKDKTESPVINALARRSRKRHFLAPILEPNFFTFFDHFFENFLITFWKTFGTILGPILGPDPPKRDQDEPKTAIRSFKEPKNCINKYWFSRGTVGIFSLLRPPKRASRGPRRLPRGTQRAPRPQKKGIQNWTQKLTNFGQILEPILGPKSKAK